MQVEDQVCMDTDEYAHGFHVTLDDGTWVTVRLDQVEAISWFPERH